MEALPVCVWQCAGNGHYRKYIGGLTRGEYYEIS